MILVERTFVGLTGKCKQTNYTHLVSQDEQRSSLEQGRILLKELKGGADSSRALKPAKPL